MKKFDHEINCKEALIAPGLIDLQINGGFEVQVAEELHAGDCSGMTLRTWNIAPFCLPTQQVDFTYDIKDGPSAARSLGIVGRGILAHGESTCYN